ncbi:MAG TPA: DUF4382 domain-containing protein [Candidatus Limnocylindria bacterium]|nr:DUF4382 domain-containing protein [Candidatus Limnocylindria bacterium]
MFPADIFFPLFRILRTRLPAVVPICAVFFMCVVLSACGGDYCVIGIFNPGGVVSGTNNGCVNNKVTGNVSVHITSATASSDGPLAPNLLHLFVTVHGIEAHPDAMAAEDSPDWEELAPDLVREPMQVDLLAQPTISCATNRVHGTAVPAGAYRQIRLRLVPNRPAVVDAIPGKNACGNLGFHCAVLPDGRTHTLTFNGGATSIRVAPDRIPAGFFSVMPDTDTHVTIEFNPFSSLANSSGDAIQLNPVFTVDTSPMCGTAMTFKQ